MRAEADAEAAVDLCPLHTFCYYGKVFQDTREAIMSRILLVVLAFIASVIATMGLTDAALAQKRVALVIGNSAYKYAGELPNPKTMPPTCRLSLGD
jgi:hypothetical protein